MNALLGQMNGIDAETGEYLFPAVTKKELAGFGTASDPKYLAELEAFWQGRQDHLGMVAGHDPAKLEEAGWGVVFAAVETPGVYEALAPLLAWRKEKAGERYREYRKELGYTTGLTKRRFLRERGAATSGPVEPEKMPYYLMLVGSPEEIPFAFQYELDVQYAVGRIHFDTVEEYANYARSVVAAEKGETRRQKTAAMFGVDKEGDPSTTLSAQFLVRPLEARIRKAYGEKWNVQPVLKEQATKARLVDLLGGAERPALLFTASHGLGLPFGHSRQEELSGGLVCQDFEKGKTLETSVFASDVGEQADVAGMIHFAFACYGAGMPQRNEFFLYDQARAKMAGSTVKPLAEQAAKPFVSKLARRLLGHPKGGALAFIGHVDRAMSYSFQDPSVEASSNIGTFESAVRKLLDGLPIGAAMEDFNLRHAELGNELKERMAEIETVPEPSIDDVSMVTDYYDARNYTVIGDPAVRLAV